jgi:hypothetical protein
VKSVFLRRIKEKMTTNKVAKKFEISDEIGK